MEIIALGMRRMLAEGKQSFGTGAKRSSELPDLPKAGNARKKQNDLPFMNKIVIFKLNDNLFGEKYGKFYSL